MPYIGNQPAPTNVTSTSITDGSIVNADINASAAIAVSKLDGVTSTNTELNLLDGVTATTAELNYVDGVTSNVQTQVDAKAPYATIAVTVVDSGGNKYALDGTVQQLGLLTPSVTYRFDQSDSSNSGHPLLLSTTSNGTHGGGSAFTTGVTAVGTPGNAGAYTQVKLEQDAPDTLYYYCSSHSGMGGEVDVRATVSSLSDLSVTSTAAELNILDGVTSTAAELNILDGVTSTAAELNILDGVTSTAAELNTLDGITAVVGELNALDIGSTAVGTAVASKAVILDSNKDYTGIRNLTITGELDAASLDVSGNVDIDGTLETDNLTVNGTQGSDGQILTSTGSGVAWEDAAAGGASDINGLSDAKSDGSTIIGIGTNALSVASGTDNVAFGKDAGKSVNSGNKNVFIGSDCGKNVTSAIQNVAIGYQANYAVGTHRGCVSIGKLSNYTLTSGNYNTCVGENSGYYATTGYENACFGYNAGYNLDTGYENTLIGKGAGVGLTTGDNVTCLGHASAPSSSGATNEITFGNNSISNLRCNDQSISGLSDERDKTKIVTLDVGLDFVSSLRPVSFEWNMRDKGRVGDADTGFIAQEITAALTNANASIPGLVTTAQNADGDETFEAAYARLIPSMVLAIKELKAENDALKARVTALENA